MISKRKLLKIRKEALINKTQLMEEGNKNMLTFLFHRYVNYVLELTQELIDLQLIEEFRNKDNK